MPKYKIGNMWDQLHKNEIFLTTTNNVIKRNGALVMGAGADKQATLLFPGIEYLFGNYIKKLNVTDYHFFILEEVVQWNKAYGRSIVIGALQTVRHYNDNSDIDLVKNSVNKLNNYAKTINTTINCPMPGIGLGKLNINHVKKITDESPDNICYWVYDNTLFNSIKEL